MDNQKVNDAIQSLVDLWCDRRDYSPLATVLPAWLGNNGLTDGWADLASALHTVANMRHKLPDAERELARRVYVLIDAAVRLR